jgi:hypothetical protein
MMGHAWYGLSSKKCSNISTRPHHKKPARKRVCEYAGTQLPSSLMPSTVRGLGSQFVSYIPHLRTKTLVAACYPLRIRAYRVLK